MDKIGLLALVGGSEWTEGCTFDAGAARRLGREATWWCCPRRPPTSTPNAWCSRRRSGSSPSAARWRGSWCSTGPRPTTPGWRPWSGPPASSTSPAGSPLHLKSVLKGSATFEALREAWAGGAVVAGSAAGAMVLTDPMVDPRGGALTVGLGLVDQLAVVPQFGDGTRRAPTARSWSARWRWPPTGCPWWGSPSAPRSSGTATGRGATRGRRRRWCSSTASRTAGLGACRR